MEAYVFVETAVPAGLGAYLRRVRRLAVDQAGCTWDCDCDADFVGNVQILADTQSAVTADGRSVVGSDSNFPATRLKRVTFDGGSCSARTTTTIATRGGSDVTVSSDGTVVA